MTAPRANVTLTHPLAYDIKTLSAAVGLGKTNVLKAIQSGDLKAFKPAIGGNIIDRVLITPEDAQSWVDNFQTPARKSAA